MNENHISNLSAESDARIASIVVWPLPIVSTCDPYELLGVKRSDEVGASKHIPPYIPRDIDSQLDTALEKPIDL